LLNTLCLLVQFFAPGIGQGPENHLRSTVANIYLWDQPGSKDCISFPRASYFLELFFFFCSVCRSQRVQFVFLFIPLCHLPKLAHSALTCLLATTPVSFIIIIIVCLKF
jgi:hypothetical protein